MYGLLHREGLERFYELGKGQTAARLGEPEDSKWLDVLLLQRPKQGHWSLSLALGGLHCSACVWAIETLFKKRVGSLQCTVNPARGSIDLVVDQRFDLHAFVSTVRGLGYVPGPENAVPEAPERALLWRLGVSMALATNVMIFSLATYTGLDGGDTYKLFQAVSFTLSTASMLVGAPIFVMSAWRSARQGIAHLDQPIALGMLLAYASSAISYMRTGGKDAYFDTLSVFIALMLLGRFLQTRAIEKNRAALVGSDGVDGLLVRLWNDGSPVVKPCTELQQGDEMLIARGDVVPTKAQLSDISASFSLDWVSGESVPRRFDLGELVPAGAFLGQSGAVRMRAAEPFSQSHLLSLLRKTHTPLREMSRVAPFYQRLTGSYVLGVFALAVSAMLYWAPRAGVDKTVSVMASLLIVTCPCAFGIAVPLAFEWAQTRLRSRGVFVRSPSLLERATRVTGVVFDKTGTLTTGVPHADIHWAQHTSENADVLYTLAASSAHPKARAVLRQLQQGRFLAELQVHETLGRGLSCEYGGHRYRLGEAGWAAGIQGDMALSRDGQLLADIRTTEELRADAVGEVQALKELGLNLHLLSGDTALRTEQIASELNVSSFAGGLRPEEKSAWLGKHADERLMMIGDGINDGLAADAAYASGTPAAESPFMAARTDFYFLSPGIQPVREVIMMARRLHNTVKQVLVLALFYNLITVSLSLSGRMSPLLCAVVMPLSSLSSIALVAWRLSERNR